MLPKGNMRFESHPITYMLSEALFNRSLNLITMRLGNRLNRSGMGNLRLRICNDCIF